MSTNGVCRQHNPIKIIRELAELDRDHICGVFSMNTSFGPNSLVIRSSS